MKLYATVTSERASKGQGGNKEVVIDLLIDTVERKEIGRVVMRYDEEQGYNVYYYPINENCTDQKLKGGRVLLYETKGKRQKGELCEEDGGEHVYLGTDGICQKCLKQR